MCSQLAGKLVCVLAFLAGVILLALPITILGGNFNVFYNDWEEDNRVEQELLTSANTRLRLEAQKQRASFNTSSPKKAAPRKTAAGTASPMAR